MDKRHTDTLHYSLKVIKDSILSPYVNDVVMYGSCGREKEKWGSDVDIMIVFNKDSRELLKEENMHRQLRILLSQISPPDLSLPEADARVEFADNYMEADDQFHINVRKDGRSVWQWI